MSRIDEFERIGGSVEPLEVVNTLALDILDGQIQTIRAVINPDKLGHLSPVADAWAVVRTTNQARH